MTGTPSDGAGARGPAVHRLGEMALIVEFAPTLTEAANRAALAFRAAVEAADWAGVEETFVALKSAIVRFDPEIVPHAEIEARLADLIASRDWARAPLPRGRTLWRIPTAFGGDAGPELTDFAAAADVAEGALIEELASRPLRVLTIGFAPGQPYLGPLPARWDVPRRTTLAPRVPVGAVVAAVRQVVLFTVSAQTGWRQIGRSAFAGFRPNTDDPFALSVGDEVIFEPVPTADLVRWQDRADAGALAATREALP